MAVRFSGTQRLHRTANVLAFDSSTICGWAQSVSHSGVYEALATIAGSASNPSDAIEMYLTSGVGLEFQHYGTGSDSASLAASVTETSPFFWALTMVGAGANGIVGYVRQNSAVVLTSATCDNGSFSAGAVNIADNGWGERFNGRVWNVKAWDRVLTAAELLVESYYRRPMFPASLNFWWPLDRHSDTVDYSGNARAPTVTGTLTTEDGPFGLWRPRRRIFVPAAAGGGTSINATSVTLTLTENAATVNSANTIGATSDTLTLTENAATVSVGTNILAGSVSLTLTENQLQLGIGFEAGVDTLTLTENAAVVGTHRAFLATSVTKTLTENAAATNFANAISAAVDELSLTENAATITVGGAIGATSATLTLTENQATVLAATSILATVDELSLVENAAELLLGSGIQATSQSLSLTGFNATTSLPFGLSATVDALSLTEFAATVAGSGLAVAAISRNRGVRASNRNRGIRVNKQDRSL